MGRRFALIFAGLVLIFATACHKNSAAGTESGSTKAAPASAVASKSRIITKDPELNRLLHPPTTEDEILANSKSYLQKKQQIEAKLASVSDPELRARLASDEWSKVDKNTFIPEGQSNLRASWSAEMRAFLDRHRADWFEVGHVDYPGSGSLNVTPVEASPLDLQEGATIALDIPTMDGVYSKFREVARQDIQAGVDDWMYEQTCTAHLKNTCQNLGGSPEECSNPERLKEISERLGGGGILIGCDDHPSAEVGQQTVEKQMRETRLVLVGQGDLLTHRIDKLLLVDYDTETILLELPPSALTGKLVWKFPVESQASKEGAASYKRLASTESFKDFGVVPIHSDSSDHEAFHWHNDSDNPQAIQVTLQGDDANDFVLQNDCSAGTIEPDESCDFTVYFAPTQVGLHSATIVVGGNWAVNSITLRGYGRWPWDISGQSSSSH